MAEPKEPQSYGSEKDWVTGDVSQEVNRQKGKPNSQHADFYSDRRESETNGPDQGGKVSPRQAAENAQPEGAATEERDPVKKVTDKESGAKTDSFFKRRDYE
jgi:hypothetical protein